MVVSFLGLAVTLPILLPVMLVAWAYDRHSPFYIAPRAGEAGTIFRMVKLRSMVIDADKSGVDSTSSRDSRITPIGGFIRRFKLDELPQLWNVLVGDMSLVGPRPQLLRETSLYTPVERGLLDVRPGMTDFSSIVFADLAEILKDQPAADIGYHQLVRPWKSRLGLFYIEHRSFWVDLQIIPLTALAIVSRPHALHGVQRVLRRLGAGQDLVTIAGRDEPLTPQAPPGSDRVVTSRDVAAPSSRA